MIARHRIVSALLILSSPFVVWGQAPAITAGGVVNAASWSNPIAPGGIAAIFGSNLTAGPQSANPPLPNTLGGTSVTINGVSAPVMFVSPTQVNVQVPSSLTTRDNDVTAARVIVTTAAGSSAQALTPLTTAVPGFFTSDFSGCGQAAALNITPDGTVSVNSTSNSAAPGDFVALFGTGFGLAVQQPPDGAVSGGSPLTAVPKLYVDGNPINSLPYSGLAPTTVGVDQVNFQIPASTRNACAIPISASQTLGGPTVTIAVHQGRGQCSDLPVSSWGQISLSESVFSSQTAANDVFNAIFPSGPNAQPSAAESIIYAPGFVANIPGPRISVIISELPLNVRSCPIPGYSNLSAGAIQVQSPSGAVLNVQPQQQSGGGGATYVASLPSGFLQPGTYTVSGSSGNAVNLNARLTVGSPIQIQTPFPRGTVISESKPLTVQWTGGDPVTLVRVSLSSQQPDGTTYYDYSYADSAAGLLTIQPTCLGLPGAGGLCSFGLAPSSNAFITVEVLSNPANNPPVTLPGVTGSVQLNWQYSYAFTGLVLSE